MVDATQNLTGTVTSAKMPEVNAVPRVNISPASSGDTAGLGVAAPVNPVSASSRPAVEINSAAAEVLASMQSMPVPVDIEAVDRIRASIQVNEYPVDYDKIAQGLADSFESMT
jgi:negative regulator of flagellin synthesis FlgM